MNNNTETKLREIFEAELRKQFRKGLLQGSVAICSVILDKTNDSSKTPEKIIADIQHFCKVSLGKKHEK